MGKQKENNWYEAKLSEPHDAKLKDAFGLLEGSLIKRVGMLKIGGCDHLTVDFLRGSETGRLILGYSDLGLWVYWSGKKGSLSEKEKLVLQVSNFLYELSGEPLIQEDAKTLSYTLLDSVSRAEINVTVAQLKTLPDDMECNAVREAFSKKEKSADDILESLTNLYASSGW